MTAKSRKILNLQLRNPFYFHGPHRCLRPDRCFVLGEESILSRYFLTLTNQNIRYKAYSADTCNIITDWLSALWRVYYVRGNSRIKKCDGKNFISRLSLKRRHAFGLKAGCTASVIMPTFSLLCRPCILFWFINQIFNKFILLR